ncbi:flippase-like domain-containing protein [Candidatus Saccharibacteria bacterium]|nr:flippase-like domain-containing protein [Candidatus Saccharibacteria bacterium]
MAKSSYVRRNWKLLLNITTLVALGVLVYAIRDQFAETFRNLFRVNAWALLLMIPVQYLNYDAQTRLYQHLFGLVGNKLSFWPIMRATLELNFVNHVFPSGGVTGLSYWGLRMKDDTITGAKAAAVHLQKLVLIFLSFELLVVFAVFALAVQGKMNSLILLLATAIITTVVIVTLGFGFVIGNKTRIAGFFEYLSRFLNRTVRLVRPKAKDTLDITQVRTVFEDLHENYKLMSRDWRALRMPIFWAFMANVWEIVTIYIVYIAFGEWVNIGAVIMAYGVANFAGLVSVLPGGVGVYEGLMTVTLSATGVPSRLSLPVTVMYRVINTLLQIPLGYYFYHRNLRQSKPARESAKAH